MRDNQRFIDAKFLYTCDLCDVDEGTKEIEIPDVTMARVCSRCFDLHQNR